MNTKILIIVGIFIAVVVAGVYFLKNPKPVTKPEQNTQSNASANPTGPVKEFSISAKEFSYSPSILTVAQGDTVKINFRNDGTTAHNFIISELNVASKTIGPGESDIITFTAGAAGSYTFFCSVDGHESLGLKGTLEVK